MLCHYAVRRLVQYYTQRHYSDCRSAECRGATTMHFWSGQKLKSTTLMRSFERTCKLHLGLNTNGLSVPQSKLDSVYTNIAKRSVNKPKGT
jgi:hypothetical protein